MSLSSAYVKANAKQVYKQNAMYLVITSILTIAVWLVVYNFSGIVEMLSSAYGFVISLCVFGFLIFSPVFLGFIRYSWRSVSGVYDNIMSLFYYFSNKKQYLRALRFAFSCLWRAALCYLIFSLPVLAVKVITGTWLYSFLKVPIPVWAFNLSNIVIFLKIFAVAATFFALLKFYLAPFLFVADENMDVDEAIHMSTVISKRTTIDYISLIISFVGWIVLSALILPLPFTFPYMIISYLIHSQIAVDNFNSEISRAKCDDIPTYIAGV